jgi:hypothetical protein
MLRHFFLQPCHEVVVLIKELGVLKDVLALLTEVVEVCLGVTEILN